MQQPKIRMFFFKISQHENQIKIMLQGYSAIRNNFTHNSEQYLANCQQKLVLEKEF
jgi:hypothetical protein